MKTRILVLAGGKSKRMKSDTPKVLMPIGGKPMIQLLLDSIERSGVDVRPAVLVGQNGGLIQNALGSKYDYIMQEEQLGTGHAVQCAEDAFKSDADAVLVLYGDHPFVRPETIKKLADAQSVHRAKIVMATTVVEDFEDWRKAFLEFGRIVRDEQGAIKKIVESKDADPAELAIKEVNPAYFCFDAKWLWDNLSQLKNDNAQREYYLTDLVQIAFRQGEDMRTLDIHPVETVGVNTPEHLELAMKLADH